MNLEQVNKELENLEVVDVSSAIKKELLEQFKEWIEIENNGIDEIDFVYADDLDGAVYDIEYKYNQLLEEYLDVGINGVNKIEQEDQFGI